MENGVLPKWEWAQVGVRALEDGASGEWAPAGGGALEDGDVVLPKWEWEQVGNWETGAKRGAGALEDGDVVLRAVVRRSGDGDDRPLVGQVHSAARTRHTSGRANKQTNK